MEGWQSLRIRPAGPSTQDLQSRWLGVGQCPRDSPWSGARGPDGPVFRLQAQVSGFAYLALLSFSVKWGQ